MITIYILSAGLVLCIILSAFFSGSEMAFSSCNTVRLENIKDENSKKAKKASRALMVTEKYEDALSAILIGNNLVNIAASSIGTVLVIDILGDRWSWVSTLVVTVLVIIFGETIPKIRCKKNATNVAMKYSGAISFLMTILKPVILLVVWLVHLITFRIKEDQNEDSEESVEELQSIIETAEDEGVLDKDQTELVQAAIDFSEVSASEVMTARVDVQAIDINDSWEDIVSFIKTTPYTRIPVYEDSIDNIIGVLHLNKLLKELSNNKMSGDTGAIDIRPILMKPCYVYKTMKLPTVLAQLKAEKQHLAIVSDEYSGTLGVVTMEDVLEQIVGDIWDETDIVEDDVVQINDRQMEVDGDLPINEFLDLLGIDEDDFEAQSETVGGWCVERLEHFPQPGDSFEFNNIKVMVLSVDGRRVEKTMVQKTEKTQEE